VEEIGIMEGRYKLPEFKHVLLLFFLFVVYLECTGQEYINPNYELIDGKYYLKSTEAEKITAKGWIDVLTPIARGINNAMNDNENGLIQAEKAEKINTSNNKKIGKQLIDIKEKYNSDKYDWFEYIYLKSHLLQISIEEVIKQEALAHKMRIMVEPHYHN